MTFTIALRIACIAFMANAAAAAAEFHNFVVLMPEAMQSANVNDLQTPALARLREEGVFYSRAFAGFPELTYAGRLKSPAGRAANLVADVRERYATLMIDEYPPPSPEAIEAALARLEQEKRPFILIYRLRALGALDKAPARPLLSPNPGGDGAAGTLLLNTDNVLAALESKLKERGLFDTTNIVVVAEHGRSTVWKRSNTSYTGEMRFSNVPPENFPPGVLAIDLIKALLQEDGGLSLYDPDQNGERVHWWQGHYPSSGNATIAVSSGKPLVRIGARGGYDVIYLPEEMDKANVVRLGRSIIERLSLQDYVSGVFIDEDRLGRVDGALSLKHLGMESDSEDGEQPPDIVVNFSSKVLPCGHPTICALSMADTPVQEGQDMAVGFSRAETASFMAARGPDFREAFSSRTPASPADMMRTIAALAGWKAGEDAKKDARELTETLRGFEGKPEPRVRTRVASSKASDSEQYVEAHLLSVNGVDYLEAAGGAGRSVGVPARPEPWRWDLKIPWEKLHISFTPW